MKPEEPMKEHIETVREALTASAALTEAIGTCHVCKGALCLDDDPPHCEDCSWDCDEHDEPNCTPMHALRMACNTPAGLDALAKIEAEHERVTTALKWITAEKHSAQVAEEQVRNENYRLLQERNRAEERLTKYFRADPKQVMAGVLDEALQAALDAARDQGKAMADDALRARVEQQTAALQKIAESRNGMIPSHTEEVRYFGESRVVQWYESVSKVARAALAAPEQPKPILEGVFNHQVGCRAPDYGECTCRPEQKESCQHGSEWPCNLHGMQHSKCDYTGRVTPETVIFRSGDYAPERKEPAQPPAPTWAEVRKVLEPFGKYAELLTDDAEYTRIGYYKSSPRVRECRAAAALLSRIPEGE